MIDIEKLKILVGNLEKSAKVRKFNTKNHIEAEAIADGLLEVDRVFMNIKTKFFPFLLSPNISEVEIEELLDDLGEELRLIVFHLNMMKYYWYVNEYGEMTRKESQ